MLYEVITYLIPSAEGTDLQQRNVHVYRHHEGACISVHADVPNRTCAECHIEGDPERWRVIANSVGHRVHLESSELDGLQCVECHATSIHEFAPIDQTCAQSGCHA